MAQLKPGQSAPAFVLSNQDGRPVQLSDFKDRRVLIYFYPRAGTSG